MQNYYIIWPETSANYQKCYTITVGDYVFKTAFSTALQLQVLFGFVRVGDLQKRGIYVLLS
jgi:hypothetical protein